MFDSRHTSTESNDTLFNPGSTRDADPGFAAPLPDAGALLAAVGMPAHAIREVLEERQREGRRAQGKREVPLRAVSSQPLEISRQMFDRHS